MDKGYLRRSISVILTLLMLFNTASVGAMTLSQDILSTAVSSDSPDSCHSPKNGEDDGDSHSTACNLLCSQCTGFYIPVAPEIGFDTKVEQLTGGLASTVLSLYHSSLYKPPRS